MNGAHPLLLYDGVCGLCNRLVQFVLKRDPKGRFHFAPLQSELARQLLERHDTEPDELDTVYVLTDRGTHNERLLSRSEAVFYVLRELGGPWRVMAVLRLLPTFLLDLGYLLVARNRYRLFGKHEHCPLPDPAWKDRFVATL